MGVDTKGYIAVQDKSLSEFCVVITTIQNACREYVKDRFNLNYPDASDEQKIHAFGSFGDNTEYKLPEQTSPHYTGGMASGRIEFMFEQEQRSLFFCAHTHDIFDDGSPSLCLILGYWGESVEIMTAILEAVKQQHGFDVYIDKNDCDDVDIEKM